jgi:hypothetical protein
MKRYFLIIASSIGLLFAACNNTANKPGKDLLPADVVNNPRSAAPGADEELKNMGILKFTDTAHSFGKLKEGDVVEFEFEYTNVGKREVLINDASSNCGCTVPGFNREPIKPGDKGVIKVKFNSEGKSGFVEKPIYVYNNGNPGQIVLRIDAEVNK